MSTNAQSSTDIPPIPQPPPAKRARKNDPQLDPLGPAIHTSKQPPRQPTRAAITSTNKGTTVAPTEQVRHVLPGRRGDDVSIRQYSREDEQFALSIAFSASHTAKALQLIEYRSYATSGELARESKFRICLANCLRNGSPGPIHLIPSRHRNNRRNTGCGKLSIGLPVRRAG
jgi:hypothetical protein